MPTPGMVANTDTIRSLSHTGISANYAKVGSVFGHSVRMLRIINPTDGDLFFSDDGVNDKWFLPASTFVLYDYGTNSHLPEGVLCYPQNVQIWVKQSTSPSTKSVYIECTYAQGQ